MIHASFNPAISPRERAHQALARQAAREGFVLLRNENEALPLKQKKIALYGIGGRMTLKGGTGSGDVNERYFINIEQGLENAGYEVTSKAWLDDYEREYNESYLAWKDMIARETAGISPYEVLRLAKNRPFQIPVGRAVSEADIAASDTDTALFVVSRQAGESHDRKLVKGDWFLTDEELANLTLIAQNYKNTILIINAGGPIDLNFLEQIEGVNAVVFYAQAGIEGGNALAEVLSGYYNFSGKLTDTWAYRYEDYPAYDIFSHMDGDVDNEEYREGIYVGYRYFDSYGIKVRYPFGYGLSYTDFDIRCTGVKLDGTAVTVSACVTNTGKTYAGREVAQLYLACPQGKLNKETKRLVAFAKTEELAPSTSQELTLSFDLADCGSYDESRSCWILEPGVYQIHLGRSAADVAVAGAVTLEREVILEQCAPCCAPQTPIPEMDAPDYQPAALPDGVPCLAVDTEAFVTVIHRYQLPDEEESSVVKKLLDSLTVDEMTGLLCGGGARSTGAPVPHMVLGAGGKTAIDLVHKGIGNIVLSDGPAGLNIVNAVKIGKNGTEYPISIPDRWNIGSYAQMGKKLMQMPGTPAYRYATAWPVHILLAQTWNPQLLEQVGYAVGTEMLEFGVTVWLAPGMNIHRNPLCGRNFEYFSEDPLLSGRMAAAITSGVQARPGVGVSLKHFACNNQEENRGTGSSDLNERTLREIYLKGFEIAVKASQPMTVMSSYNKINGVFNGTNNDLLNRILRCEWGFRGLVMTDWGSRCDVAHCAACGNDLYMPGDNGEADAMREAVRQGTLSLKDVRRAAARVLKIIVESDIYSCEFQKTVN